MPTQQQRTLTAIRQLMSDYRNPVGKYFFTGKHCALCIVHSKSCSGCPNAFAAPPHKSSGCGTSPTLLAAQDAVLAHYSDQHREILSGFSSEIRLAFEARAKFWEERLPRLAQLPSSMFTQKGKRVPFNLEKL